jgi:hypothetical protein
MIPSTPNLSASARQAFRARYGETSPELDMRAHSGGGQLSTPKESSVRPALLGVGIWKLGVDTGLR